MTLTLILLLILCMLLGLPLYLVIAGATLIAFNMGAPNNPSLFIEMLRMVDSPTLLAIPLFTLAGYILSASQAPKRLVALSNAFLSWLPGGLAVVAIVTCALLTAFTGASGVTIIALGGLLYPSLMKQGYERRFTTGLLTTSGSRGLLFPPSLPLILYAIVIKESIDNLFKACLVPGLLGLGLMITYAVRQGKKQKLPSQPFSMPKAWQTFKSSWMELPLPILVLGGIYGGFITVTEAAAIAAAYALIVEVGILREVHWLRDLPNVTRDAMTLVGSILIILAAAFGFTSYLVDEQIPMQLLKSMEGWIDSPIAFLLFLNVFLLIVGCVMDIFSAIIIVVPLLHPIATQLGIDPFHLGAIFLTNLEIGYSTPPIGLNLFIASSRFKQNILELYKATLPFLAILILALMMITFIPELSLWWK